MIINKAILNIIDKENNMLFNSSNELALEIEFTTFLDKMIERIFSDNNKCKGMFNDDSYILDIIEKYNNNEIDFISLNKNISEKYYSYLKLCDDYKKSDLIGVEFSYLGNKYYGFLCLENKEQFIHNVNMTDNGINNSLIINNAIIPNVCSIYMIINLDTLSLVFKDKKRLVDKETKMIIPDLLCSSSKELSIKKTLNMIKKAVIKVSEDTTEVHNIVAQTKAYIYENSKENIILDTNKLSEVVFKDNDLLKEEFNNKITNYNIPKEIEVPREAAVKEGFNHKITTDTGIEIIFPSEYSLNNNFINFINNNDGTISIEIKNIGKITNK